METVYHAFRKSLQNFGILIAKMNNFESVQPALDAENSKGTTDSSAAEPLEIIEKEVNNNENINQLLNVKSEDDFDYSEYVSIKLKEIREKMLNAKQEDDFDYSEYVSIRLKEIRENCKNRDLRESFEVPYQRK